MTQHGFRAVFSDRDGGCSPPPFSSLNLGFLLGDSSENVAKNLDVMCRQAGLVKPHQAQQVHGSKVLHCRGVGKLHAANADILIADDVYVSLAVRTADCLPILLADPNTKVIAAVHAGWRGAVARVVDVAVSAMVSLGAKPEHMIASLGPCIGPCCFEIHVDIANQLQQSCGEDFSFTKEHKLFVDLRKVAVAQLLQGGVQQSHIEISALCTACQPSPGYFSYRRDHGKTGRQLAMISAC